MLLAWITICRGVGVSDRFGICISREEEQLDVSVSREWYRDAVYVSLTTSYSKCNVAVSEAGHLAYYEF